MGTTTAKFAVGQLIQHRMFDYRGVIVDVDPEFHGTEEWYETVARSRPPKDAPWYHVLVNGGEMQTYVAECNMEPDDSGAPISHPGVEFYFEGLGEEGYIPRRKGN